MADNDVSKLPKWAQRKIAQLEREVEDLSALVVGDVNPDETNVFIDRFQDATPLPRGSHVRFNLASSGVEAPWSERVEVYLVDRGGGTVLEIQGGSAITIQPVATNAAQIAMRRR